MELLIIFACIAIPLVLIAIFAMYKERQEKQREQQLDFRAT